MTTEEIEKRLDDKFKDVQQQLADAQKKGDATSAQLDKLEKEIEKSGNELESFIEANKKKEEKDFSAQFIDFLQTNKDNIQNIVKNKTGVVEFVPKAVGPITTASGEDVTTPSHLWHTNLGHFNFRDDNPMISYATVTSTNSPVYAYTDLAPKDGDFEFVAEGGRKPQIDFEWKNRFAEPVKAAAHEVLTEEAVTDIARMESVAREYLKKKHDLFKAKKLYVNAGNPNGATNVATSFNAGGMAGRVQDPVFMDAVNAIITQVYTSHNFADEASYMPNLVLVNPVDFFLELVAAKDKQGRPLYPQAGLFNSVSIGGVTIRPWEGIDEGKLFVADMKMMNVVNYIPFSIRLGWINNQFIDNQFTMLGESRYFQFVKNFDKKAFVYDDLETVITAIEKQ